MQLYLTLLFLFVYWRWRKGMSLVPIFQKRKFAGLCPKVLSDISDLRLISNRNHLLIWSEIFMSP